MKSQINFVSGRMLWKTIVLNVAGLLLLILTAPLFAQNCPNNPGVRTICKQIGNAEVVSVTSPYGAYPTTQPVVYWHDDEWKIDMLPETTHEGELRMKITANDGREKIVKFPAEFFAQIDSISRSPEDKAIVIGEVNGTSRVFSIVELKTGKEISGGLLYHPSISPNRRFLLYKNWFPPHAESPQENQFILYDTLKTPEENICGYGENNPEYKRNSEALSGIQVYPYQASCLIGNDVTDDNQSASNFIWSSDSSKVVFADVKSGVISLILVIVRRDDNDKDHDRDRDRGHDRDREGDHDRDHRGYNDRPRTFIYTFTGTEDVCAGAATCDSNNVRSIAWNGDSVDVALIQVNPTGPAIEKDLTIPLSKFVPIGK